MIFKFEKEDFRDHATLVFYNRAIGDNKAIAWEFDDKEYIMADAYCKNPECTCQSTFIIIAPKDNITEGKGFFYNYENKAFEESEHDIPLKHPRHVPSAVAFLLLGRAHPSIFLGFLSQS